MLPGPILSRCSLQRMLNSRAIMPLPVLHPSSGRRPVQAGRKSYDLLCTIHVYRPHIRAADVQTHLWHSVMMQAKPDFLQSMQSQLMCRHTLRHSVMMQARSDFLWSMQGQSQCALYRLCRHEQMPPNEAHFAEAKAHSSMTVPLVCALPLLL